MLRRNWLLILLMTCVTVALLVWIILRIRLTMRVQALQQHGAWVSWDVEILRTEGGSLNEDESRTVRDLRRFFIGQPHVVMFSHLLRGSEEFQSYMLKDIGNIAPIQRLVIDGLQVNAEDLEYLVRTGSIEKCIAIYGASGLQISAALRESNVELILED